MRNTGEFGAQVEHICVASSISIFLSTGYDWYSLLEQFQDAVKNSARKQGRPRPKETLQSFSQSDPVIYALKQFVEIMNMPSM